MGESVYADYAGEQPLIPQFLRAGCVVLERITFAGSRTDRKRQPTLSEVPPEREPLVRVAPEIRPPG
jgi:hypothetical protein